MERNIDSGKRNSCKATLQLDVTLQLLLLLSATVTLLDYVSKHLLDFLNGEGLGQLESFSKKLNVAQ